MRKNVLFSISAFFLSTLTYTNFAGLAKTQAQAPSGNFSKTVRIAANPVLGGSYSTVRSSNTGGQVHHMPAFKAYSGLIPLTYSQGPAIWMETVDHRATASCGSSNVAKAHRAKLADLIKQNKFKEAMDLDIADVKSLFPGKYDTAISQAVTYYGTIKTSTVPNGAATANPAPDDTCPI